MKQLPIEFEEDFNNSSLGFEGQLENGDYVSARHIRISFELWDCGWMMCVKILERYSSQGSQIKTREIFNQVYYDKDFPKSRLQMAAMQDVRGRTAEGMAYDLFMDICGMEVYEQFFPKAFAYHNKRKTK